MRLTEIGIWRRVAEAEAGEGATGLGGEARGRGRGGRSSLGRGRGARPPVGGRGASSLGRGEGSTRVPETAEALAPPGLPSLEWTIGVKGPSGVREMIDIPRLPQPPMRLPT